MAITSTKIIMSKAKLENLDFSDALRYLKSGEKISRTSSSLILHDSFIVYQKGYPNGIPCNKQTAEVYGMNEGDLFICNPYLQIQNADGSHSMWTPSIDDILANDWAVVEVIDADDLTPDSSFYDTVEVNLDSLINPTGESSL